MSLAFRLVGMVFVGFAVVAGIGSYRFLSDAVEVSATVVDVRTEQSTAALLPAEDGSGDWVVRLYHAYRGRTDCKLQWTLPVVQVDRTNMLEEVIQRMAMPRNGELDLTLGPFEIQTLRLRLGASTEG